MKIRLSELREAHDNNFGECGVLELTRAPRLTRSAPSPGCAPDSHDRSGTRYITDQFAAQAVSQAQLHGFSFFKCVSPVFGMVTP